MTIEICDDNRLTRFKRFNPKNKNKDNFKEFSMEYWLIFNYEQKQFRGMKGL